MDSQGKFQYVYLGNRCWLRPPAISHRQDSFALLHTLHAAEHTEDITSIAWSPDDSMLLLGVECAIKLYDVQVSSMASTLHSRKTCSYILPATTDRPMHAQRHEARVLRNWRGSLASKRQGLLLRWSRYAGAVLGELNFHHRYWSHVHCY